MEAVNEDIVQIHDANLTVSIAPSFGNNAYSILVNGHEILWRPHDSFQAWREDPQLGGIPILSPWANRLDQEAYYANGRKYLLNSCLGNVRYDSNHLPIHGLVADASEWNIIRQDDRSVTSRLEFWRFPQWMAQFPFAHTLEVTHRVAGGSLEVETAVENFSNEPMPLSLGYHPFLRLTDCPRAQWKVHLAARERVALSDKLAPAGGTRMLSTEECRPSAEQSLDDIFISLTGEDFSMEGERQRIAVRHGEKFPVAVVYAPANGAFICFEPMSAQTNAFNLTQAGVAAGLQHIPPGRVWRESFWITPTGF
jgi:aldose 1-epimerase